MTGEGGHLPWAGIVRSRLDAVRGAGRWRRVRSLEASTAATVDCATGAELVSFASNDYLGLSRHPRVVEAAAAALDRWGAGAGSARLIVGARPVHEELEDALAAWKGAEAALVFPTGYQANVGVIGALAAAPDRPPLILSDRLNHASLIDGSRLARAEVKVFDHGDVEQVAALLAASGDRPALVVTDTVFSMDGDLAPVGPLSEVCRDRGALLVLDDAHEVFGDVDPPVEGTEVVRIGTLSKALGSQGGFVAADRAVIELCVNTARAFIFTTAPFPAAMAAALAAVGVVTSAEGADLRGRLRSNVDLLAPDHPTPILPVPVGQEGAAMAASEALAARGMLVPAIRPPTVPPGTARLRVALSAQHSPEQVADLGAALASLGLGIDKAEVRV